VNEAPSIVNHDAILELFRDGPDMARRAFVDSCPFHPLRDGAAGLAASDDMLSRVLALGLLANAYCNGLACAIGAEIAVAGRTLGEEILEAGAALQPTTLSSLAYWGVNALRELGRKDEALAFCERVLPLHEALDREDPNVHSLRIARVDILLDLGRVDHAEDALRRDARGVRGAAEAEVRRLEMRIKEIKRPAADMEEETVVGGSLDAESAELDRWREARRVLAKHRGLGAEANEASARERILEASSFLQEAVAGHDPARLRDAAEALREVRRFTKSASPALDCDALWPLSICLDRLGEYGESVEVLERLRGRVEDLRAGISDPLRRAGVDSRYPHLYANLCRNLTRLGRPEDLLSGIEGAKGRAVADVLAAKTGQPVDDRESSRPAKSLPRLLAAANAHYISFFVDSEKTYAVFVAKDGTLYAAPAIPLGAAALREAAATADPETWGRDQQVPRALEPLMDWLVPLFERGVLVKGDHISWSPDGALHEIPLQYVRFCGAPVVDTFGISRVHGVRALALLLERPVTRPGHYIGVEVPFEEDLGDPGMLRNLHRGLAWLRGSKLPGTSFEREAARLERVSGVDLTDAVVHFATHGTFPATSERGPFANPFRGSGLVLADGGRLPSKGRIARGEDVGCILTPERILDSKLDLAGSHVTLQACVSGLAREGVGGDALGLEWALFQSGAVSVLSSHWDIDLRESSTFVERFYEEWVGRGRSRGEAWREVVLAARRGVGPLSRPRGWAAFSISGDWR
jgi:tetratricopeptide (TPR) repeat protein